MPTSNHIHYDDDEDGVSSEATVANASKQEPAATATSDGEADSLVAGNTEETAVPVEPRKQFDPLVDLLGIASTPTENSHADTGITAGHHHEADNATAFVAGYGHAAGIDQTAAQRIANVKSLMARGHGAQMHMNQHASGFGVDGSNMQVALYGQQNGAWTQHPQQQQAYNEAMMQQQQQQMYHTMAMQQQMAPYQSMAPHQQQMMATYSPQQQMMLQQQMMPQQQQVMLQQQQMIRMHGQGNIGHVGGRQVGVVAGVRSTGGNSVGVGVPAMHAERALIPEANYKVQRGTKPSRVSAGDQAFGPILDDLKAKLAK